MKKIITILLCICFSLSIVGCDFDSVMDRKYAKAKEAILSQLHDPDSYEMEYKKYSIGEVSMKIKFRANNRLGAKVIQYAYVTFVNDGKADILYMGSQEDPKLDFMYD